MTQQGKEPQMLVALTKATKPLTLPRYQLHYRDLGDAHSLAQI